MAASLCLAPPALAQVSGSLAVSSDYRYRGHTLSDEKPTAALNLAYDHESGLYGGASLIVQDTSRHGPELLGHIAYAGYAARRPRGPGVDVGVINYNFTSYRFGKRTVDYTEVYAGLTGEHAAAHLYYAPDYYQSGVRTLYLDLAAALRPAPGLRAFGHLGVLAPVGGRSGRGAGKTRYDLRAGIAAQIRQAEISLTWTRLDPPDQYPSGRRSKRDALILGAAYFF